MDTDLDTLATAIYVSTDDLLKARPELVPWRPAVGMKPKVSDAEMVTLAVLSALLGFDDEARWVRHVRAVAPPVPLPAAPARLQQMAAPPGPGDGGPDRAPGRRHQRGRR